MVLKPNATVDISKPGAQLQNLTGMWNARVLDGYTPFIVQFMNNGLPMNLTGMQAFIEGEIGEGHYESASDDIVMTSNPTMVSYTDDGSGNSQMGLVVFRLPPQFFVQAGLFNGYIGLKNESGIRVTSSNVWFKVLGNSYNMGIACKYFISDFQKALDTANGKIDAALQDLYKKYDAKTGKAETNLGNILSAMDEIKSTQQNLSTKLTSTKQQINENDVVTRPEFLNLSNQLTQQVSQMKEAGLEFFNNADGLKAKYPQGANKLCVTLNDSHEWIYDFANNQWNDAGAFNYGTIDPKLTRTIYTKNPDNLIVNSDFNGLDMWNAQRDQTDPNVYIDTSDAINGSNAVVINGYVKDGSNNESWILSKDFPVDPTKNPSISIGVETYIQGINTQAGDTANIELDMVDKDGNTTRWYKQLANNSDYQKTTWENIILPENTVSCYIGFTMWGLGQVRIRRPQVNFGPKLLPYSKANIVNAFSNLLANSPIVDWCLDQHNNAFSISKDTTYDGQPTLKLATNDNFYNFPTSPLVKVDPGAEISVSVPLRGSHDYLNGKLYLEINQYEDYRGAEVQSVRYGSDALGPLPSDKFKKYLFNGIKLADTTHYITVKVVAYGQADLYIGNVSLHQSRYSFDTINRINDYLGSKNCFFSHPVADWVITGSIPNAVFVDQSILDKNNNSTIKILTSGHTINDNVLIAGANNPIFKVDDKYFSFKISYCLKTEADKGSLIIGLRQFNSQSEPLNFSKEIDLALPDSDNLVEKEFDNLRLNDDTKYIIPFIYVRGLVDANFGNFEQIENPPLEEKLVAQSNPSTWRMIGGDNFSSQYSVSRTDKIEINSNIHDVHEYLYPESQIIPVKGNQTYTFKVSARIVPTDQNEIYLAVEQGTNVDEVHDNKKESHFYFKTNSDYQDYIFTLTTNSDTKFLLFRFVFHSAGLGSLGNLKVYLGTPNEINPENDNINTLPYLDIKSDGTITDKWANAPFTYIDGKRHISGYLQYAMQGDSSRTYPKKNLKLKFFEDDSYKKKLKWKPKADWDKNHKFNLKANYIDATQARNLVNSELFAKATAITPFEHNSQKPLLKTQNLGQMEGFPVELYFNGSYYGLMTLNTKKDDKPYGLDSDNKATEGLTVESYIKWDDPDGNVEGAGKNYATILQDTTNPVLKDNFIKFLKFIKASTDEEFKSKLKTYVDVTSVINCMLWGTLAQMHDSSSKSMIWLTWNNGLDFYITLYDMDSTWNLYWNGSKLTEESAASFDSKNKLAWGNSNKLYSRIFDNFKPEIQKQYQKLRSTVWSNAQISSAFKHFINSIPEEAYEREQEKWPDIPSKNITDFAQIQQSIITRGNAMDEYMANLVLETDPLEEIKTRLTNLEHNGTTQK